MRIIFLISGIFCMLYYLVLTAYIKRPGFAFAPYWIISSVIRICVWTLIGITGCRVFEVTAFVFFMLYLLVAVCGLIIVLLGAPGQGTDSPEYIIVLGAKIYKNAVSRALVYRLEKACEALEKYPSTRLILSGGQGADEDISEAVAMREYLLGKGIPGDRLILEDRSTSTYTNFKYSAELIGGKTQPVAFVTNSFHIRRAMKIAREYGFENIFGIAAKSSPVTWLNNAVREVAGMLFYGLFRKKYLSTFGG